MLSLNLPVFDTKINVRNGKNVIFDVIRKRYVALTPEEWVYNAQPGVVIDYATGDSWLEGGSSTVTEEPVQNEPQQSTGSATYILNTNSKKFHYPDCSSVDQMNESNKQEFFGTRDEAIAQGYDPCGRCNP